MKILRKSKPQKKISNDFAISANPKQRMFVLAVMTEQKDNGTETTNIKTKGQNMPLPEAIFYVEQWLEQVKENLKRPFKENFKLE